MTRDVHILFKAKREITTIAFATNVESKIIINKFTNNNKSYTLTHSQTYSYINVQTLSSK